jgi:lipoprotein-releasing system ATP-binding protein
MFSTHRSLRERRERASELLAGVGLAGKEHRRPPELSGGERQRVAVARALANEPPVLLADEPTGSLDVEAVGELLALLERLREERGLTIVLVTHDEAVAGVADRKVTMVGGQLA